MAVFDWIQPGVPADFNNPSSWFDEGASSTGVAVPGSLDTANIGAGDLITIAANQQDTVGNLVVYQNNSFGSLPAAVNGDLTVAGQLSFQLDVTDPAVTAHLEITGGIFTLTGTAGNSTAPIDSIAIGGSPPPPSPEFPRIFVDDPALFQVVGGTLFTDGLSISGSGGFGIAAGGSVTVGGSLLINQTAGAPWITIAGIGPNPNNPTVSSLEVIPSANGTGDISLDGRLMVTQGGSAQADNVTISSQGTASLQVGTYNLPPDPAAIDFSVFTANNVTLGDGQGGSGYLVAAPGSEIFIKQTLALSDTVTDTQSFAGEVTTEGSASDGGSIEIGGHTGAAADSIVVDAGGLLSGHGLVNSPSVEDNGTISAQGGLLLLEGNLSGTGNAIIQAQSSLEIDGKFGGGNTASFAAATGTLILDDLADFNGQIGGLSIGDTIQINNAALPFGENVIGASILNVNGTPVLRILEGTVPGSPTSEKDIALTGASSPSNAFVSVAPSTDGLGTSLTLTNGLTFSDPGGNFFHALNVQLPPNTAGAIGIDLDSGTSLFLPGIDELWVYLDGTQIWDTGPVTGQVHIEVPIPANDAGALTIYTSADILPAWSYTGAFHPGATANTGGTIPLLSTGVFYVLPQLGGQFSFNAQSERISGTGTVVLGFKADDVNRLSIATTGNADSSIVWTADHDANGNPITPMLDATDCVISMIVDGTPIEVFQGSIDLPLDTGIASIQDFAASSLSSIVSANGNASNSSLSDNNLIQSGLDLLRQTLNEKVALENTFKIEKDKIVMTCPVFSDHG